MELGNRLFDFCGDRVGRAWIFLSLGAIKSVVVVLCFCIAI